MDKYWIGGAGNWNDTAHWSATSGGEGGAGAPTASDDAIIDWNSGFGEGGTIILTDQGDCKDLTFVSGNTFTLDGDGYTLWVHGSLILEATITILNDPLALTGAGGYIYTAGLVLGLTFSGAGTWTLLADLELSSDYIFSLDEGTFDANDFNVKASGFNLYGTASVFMGSGTWEVTSNNTDEPQNNGNVWEVAAGVTITEETSTIKLSDATNHDKSFVGGGKTYNNLWLTGAGTGNFIIFDSNTFNQVKMDTPPHSLLFEPGSEQTILDPVLVGTSGKLITIDNVGGTLATASVSVAGTGYSVDEVCPLFQSNGARLGEITVTSIDGSGGITGFTISNGGYLFVIGTGNIYVDGGNYDAELNCDSVSKITTQHILSKSSGAISCDYLNISNSNANGGATWYAGSHSVDTNNNDGWTFIASPRYWVGGTGNWSDTDHWSNTSGGSGGANIPTLSDDVFIDSNSGFGEGGTIAIDDNFSCHDLIASSGHNYTITNNFTSYSLSIYGSMTLEGTISWEILPLSFCSSSVGEVITTAGNTLNYIEFIGVGGEWTLQDDLVTGGEFVISNGTFDANDHNIIANDFVFYAATGYTPTVIMGSGIWEVTGGDWYVDEYNNEVVVFTPETSTIKFTYTGASQIGLLNYVDGNNPTTQGHTYYNFWLTDIGTGDFNILGCNHFNDFKIDTPTHAITFQASSITTVSSFSVSGAVGNLISINSNDNNTQFVLSKPSGIVSCDYLDINNSFVTGNPIEPYWVDVASSSWGLYSSSITKVSQSFKGNGGKLEKIHLSLYKSGLPTGNAVAKIYAHSGVFGTSSVPTGPALATSDNFDVSTLSESPARTEIKFTGANMITLEKDVNYCLVFEYSGGDASNIVYVDSQGTGSNAAGNPSDFDGATWTPYPSQDILFEIFTTGGGALWYAGSHSVDTANNDGWLFEDVPVFTKIHYSPINIISGHQYKLVFRVRPTANVDIRFKLQDILGTTIDLDDTKMAYANIWKIISATFTATFSGSDAELFIQPNVSEIMDIYIDQVVLIDLTVEQKSYRLMRIQGSMMPGSFLQTLTLREIAEGEITPA